MAEFTKEMLDPILRWEGGYSDHAADPGGATKFGITRRTLSRWRKHPVSKEHVRQMKLMEARMIYLDWYWNPCRCDDLPAPLALAVFDCAVNQGPKRARKFLQRVAGVKTDGIIGPVTIKAVWGMWSAEKNGLLRDFMARRALHYSSLRHIATFGRGWFRRLFDIHQRALELI